MKIALIVEGRTEQVFMGPLRNFLRRRLEGSMPNIDPMPRDGRIPTGDKLRRVVDHLLSGKKAADHVIALTDVYTGTREFTDAADAKAKMRAWVGFEPRFHPHAAQFDFEAWLLPYWDDIRKLSRSNRTRPPGPPEAVNHNSPPAHRIKAVFEASSGRSYSKTRDAAAILREKDLSVAIAECPELKALVNTILRVSNGAEIP